VFQFDTQQRESEEDAFLGFVQSIKNFIRKTNAETREENLKTNAKARDESRKNQLEMTKRLEETNVELLKFYRS